MYAAIRPATMRVAHDACEVAHVHAVYCMSRLRLQSGYGARLPRLYRARGSKVL